MSARAATAGSREDVESVTTATPASAQRRTWPTAARRPRGAQPRVGGKLKTDDRSDPTRVARRARDLDAGQLFALAAGVVIPVLAYLIYQNGSTLWLPALLVVLTVLALLYVWRFGLHPRLRVTDQNC